MSAFETELQDIRTCPPDYTVSYLNSMTCVVDLLLYFPEYNPHIFTQNWHFKFMCVAYKLLLKKGNVIGFSGSGKGT